MKPMKITLEPTHKLVLGGLAAAVLLVLLVRLLYVPVIGRVGEQRSILHNLRVKIADARVQREQLPDYERALQQAQEEYRILQRRLGGAQSMARVLESLGRLAEAHRLELVAVQPRTEEGEEPVIIALGPDISVREIPLSVEVTGRYRQLGEFLGSLPEASFISEVQELQMHKAEAWGTKLQVNLVLAVYLAEKASER